MKPIVTEKISLEVNGKIVEVLAKDISPDLSLARFLRDHLHLTGTKISCGQGGCGSCVVTVGIPDPVDGTKKIKAVNSCLTPVLVCNGWSVTTVEGLGSTKQGLNPIQERLANFHGTQCGFCTPGMVMSMNSLKESGATSLDQKSIEDILDGNICRCTGYRPILDAFKSFATDAPDHLKKKVADIEDIAATRCLVPCTNGKTNGASCHGNGDCISIGGHALSLPSGVEWQQPANMQELLTILKGLKSGQTYKLVAGNTGTGIYEDGDYSVFVDVNRVKELKEVTKSPLALGAGVSINDAINIMEDEALTNAKYTYGKDVSAHWKKVANVAVRNVGSIAGNLMLKHAYKDFPSDVFTVLEAVGAKIVVTNVDGRDTTLNLEEWLKQSMDKKVVKQVVLPELDKTFVFRSYKISPRSQNAHAYVNAAFLAKVDPSSFKVLETPRIVYGGISNEFVHASKTENFLVNKSLKDLETLKGAFKLLDEEVIPDNNPLHATAAYRKHLTKALLYKFVLAALGDNIPAPLRSGALQISRGISRGEQYFQTDPSLFPINEPIQKLEGRIQCTGEAEYVADTPPFPGELAGAFVLSKQGNCEIASVDPSDALAMPGVVAFVDHGDIPGVNDVGTGSFKEEVFCSGKVHYAGQSIGLILANTFEQASRAAEKVKVEYKNAKKPVLTLRDAIKEQERVNNEIDIAGPEVTVGEHDVFKDGIENEFEGPVQTIQGEIEIGSQYHFHLETQTCIVRPIEDNQFEVLSATQWITKTQNVLSAVLQLPRNNFDMKVRRLGGAFGGKISKCIIISAACAVAASKLHRPVRIVLDLKTNMEMVGKRLPYLAKYKVVVSAEGELRAVGMKLYCDCGYTFNEATVGGAVAFAQSSYASKNWRIVPTAVVTNTPSNTYVRAPGSTQGHAIMEYIMEHVANQLGMDPLELRIKNLLKSGDEMFFGKKFEEDGNPALILIDQVKNSSRFAERKSEIQTFNQSNKWKKRGLSLVPIRYPHSYFGTKYHVLVSVFAGDGTVSVSHGGIEMGQGLNTKVAQIVAKELGIPVDTIRIKPSNNMVAPNDSVTGGSMGSECCASGAQIACQELKARMKAVKDKLPNPNPTWLELVKACDQQAIDLTARHMAHPGNDGIQDYTIWAAIATEVEIDILTGEMNIKRADLVEDTGSAISPEIDVGQVEGGFIMGLGLWLTEMIRYDETTGRLLTRSTWDYSPPASHDIPEEMRTTFYNSGNNPKGILGSKATGEPTVMMGIGVIFAIRDALNSARKEAGFDPKMWYILNGPATVESIQQSGGIGYEHFTI